MSFELNARRLGVGLLCAALTALFVWFGTGLEPWWPLLWVAPLPVLTFAPRASWWGAALVALSAWFVGSFNLWGYYHTVLEMPAGLLVRIFMELALIFTLAVLLFRALLKRGAVWSALLAFPALRVSAEYIVNLISVHGTGSSLAYTQLGFLPLLQVASLTGPWGVSFFPMLFASAVAIGIHLYPSHKPLATRVVGASLGLIALLLVFGAVRLVLPPPEPPVKVGLATSDGPNAPVAKEGEPTMKLFRAYGEQVKMLAARGAQVVVLPEKLAVTVDPDTQWADSFFQSLAEETRAVIVVGVLRVAPPREGKPVKYNEARVYVPGAEVASYDKQHMLPPFESALEPGKTLTLLPRGPDTWGVAICKDMDFTPLSRIYGLAGAGLMLVPGWDFDVDAAHHGHMAIMRGVESGFSVVRAAKNGYLTVADNRGRILAEAVSGSAPFVTLLAEVPATHDGTLYQVLGDWFAWVVLGMLGFSLARLVFLWRRA